MIALSQPLVRYFPRVASLATLLVAGGIAEAAPALLHEVFQDHAVLQRGQPIAVWGDATPGESIFVTLNDISVEGRANAEGHWRVTLPAMPAGGPYHLRALTQPGDRGHSSWRCLPLLGAVQHGAARIKVTERRDRNCRRKARLHPPAHRS